MLILVDLVLVSSGFLQRLVDQDNHRFEEWCTEMAEMRRQSVDKGKAKHEEVKELYELLPVQDGTSRPSSVLCPLVPLSSVPLSSVLCPLSSVLWPVSEWP